MGIIVFNFDRKKKLRDTDLGWDSRIITKHIVFLIKKMGICLKYLWCERKAICKADTMLKHVGGKGDEIEPNWFCFAFTYAT